MSIIVHTSLGTTASLPTMCFIHKARTIEARIARSVMFTRSISGKERKKEYFWKKGINGSFI